jgi:thiamine thiazole synthase
MAFDETAISSAIVRGYHEKLLDRLTSDVIVVGAGPSGLVAAMDLAAQGAKVAIVERRLTPGGGVWGGAMAMNEVVVQPRAAPLLDELKVRSRPVDSGLHRVDAVELAAALILHAVRNGAVILNMTTAEDICVHDGRVSGVVINRSSAPAPLPIDPLTLKASAVVDATGHDAAVVAMLRRRELIDQPLVAGEGPMNAEEGERFVVEQTDELHAGLWVCGMAVCATWGGPRMGPIFGGMLLSGRRCAEQLCRSVRPSFHAGAR